MVDVIDPDKLEFWLGTQPTRVSVLIAARVAARVFPLIFTSSRQDISAIVSDFPERALPIFRDIAVSQLMGTWRTIQTDFSRYSNASHTIYPLSRADFVDEDAARAAADIAAFAAWSAVEQPSNQLDLFVTAVRMAAAATLSGAKSAERLFFWLSIQSDVDELLRSARGDFYPIESLVTLQRLTSFPLWFNGRAPEVTAHAWAALKQHLLSQNEDWDVWVEFYERLLQGDSITREFVLAFVDWPDEDWDTGPAHINRKIKERLAEIERKSITSEPSNGTSDQPQIPVARPALIEPVWDGQTLTIPIAPLGADISPDDLHASLLSLKDAFSQLIDQAKAESNIDPRALRTLERVEQGIPTDPPDQKTLFTIAHRLELIESYRAVVAREWPDTLSAEYQAVALQYDRTVRQFPRWRTFVTNARSEKLSPDEIRAAGELAAEAEQILGIGENWSPISPRIGDAWRQLKELIPTDVEIALSNEMVEDGMSTIAFDVVESFDNILKRLAEQAVKIREWPAGARGVLMRWIDKIGNDPTIKASAEQAREVYRKEFPKMIRNLVKAGIQLTPYFIGGVALFVVTGTLFGFGIVSGIAAFLPLTTRYKWAKDLVDLLKRMFGQK